MKEDGTSKNPGVQEKKKLEKGVKQHVEADQESDTENTESYLGKYVVVSYNGSAYPGFVKEIGYEDINVSGMHQIGRKKNFFWSKKIVDECWYTLDNILAIIPEPEKLDGSTHYKINDNIWKKVTEK